MEGRRGPLVQGPPHRQSQHPRHRLHPLSSAIASNLAKGYGLDESVEKAKAYISGALAAMLDLGHGSGPMDHAFDIRPEYRIEAR